ncbi:uncharacterized protein LOC124434430 [Xenia sp. Carnegie-2017]|uniref:uncharacterized protein LOC124434430 n=1 Tax=Xenia sp. Carnegie-2017 TaxID=2897299 RepID=UPI001F04A943|nr:uncharacterized protein LOC124434430 [Xenia sp. Carnegie-2017]
MPSPGEEKILDLINEASDLLKEIANDSKNPEDPIAKKINKFNSHVARAQLEIQLCRDFLDEAKTSIDEMMEKVNTVKYLSRGVRLLGCGVTWYSLYRILSSTSKPEDLASYVVPSAAVKRLGFPLPPLAGCEISGYLWLSCLRPRRAYELRENLEKMKEKHKRLEMELNYLDRRLKLLQKSYPPSQGSV